MGARLCKVSKKSIDLEGLQTKNGRLRSRKNLEEKNSIPQVAVGFERMELGSRHPHNDGDTNQAKECTY